MLILELLIRTCVCSIAHTSTCLSTYGYVLTGSLVFTRAPSTPCLKNVPPLACYNFDAHEWILIFFGRNVTDKVGNQKTLYMPPQITCASALPVKTGKRENHIFSLSWVVLHTQCTCALSSGKNKLSSVMCLIASNIC